MIEYRHYKEDDADQISNLVRNCLSKINRKDYSNEIIDGLIEYFSPTKIKYLSTKCQKLIVAVIGFKIIGLGGLENDGIRMLFVDHEFLNMGIGAKVLNILEDSARNSGFDFLKTQSSITSVGFYQKQGFVIENEEISPRAGKIINMKKSLKRQQ